MVLLLAKTMELKGRQVDVETEPWEEERVDGKGEARDEGSTRDTALCMWYTVSWGERQGEGRS